MKIAIIRKECTFSRGGAERYCLNLAKALAEMDNKIYILSEKCDTGLHSNIVHVPVKVNHLTSSTKNLSYHYNCQRALEKFDVDKVYALSRTYPADAFRVSDPLHIFWMNVKYSGKLEKLFQKINPRHSTILKLEKNIFNQKNTKSIITNSEFSKKTILEYFQFPSERIKVIYNGVDLEKFTPNKDSNRRKFKKNSVNLLFVGQDFKRKGLNEILESLFILQKKGFDTKLTVVGGDNPRPFIKKSEEMKISHKVKFVGKSANVEDYYKTSDLMVFPTLYDPFANVCLEALACGLPVITSRNNGFAEIIDEGRDGFVLSSNNNLVYEIVEKVTCFGNLPFEERDLMSIKSRKKAEKYTINRNAIKTLEVLKDS